ncbi:NADH-quinone oxidoreductase subunit N [Tunicatimonas pelagia]|uniref:NADH-quinone oxidoreductase subunit N n=1 Tax=Tunicatimonas pelagia TaxID=931531 RepID=UPI002665D8BF|nr:NADH-quinone oxidoreductase subunit N [Tunicatimonas pelagia]WKN41842.1 NADH-quinone oxidoreductase subunit N [Tunicatimonas pelagia]
MEITTTLANDLRVILRSATWLWPEVVWVVAIVVVLLTDLIFRRKSGLVFTGLLAVAVVANSFFLLQQWNLLTVDETLPRFLNTLQVDRLAIYLRGLFGLALFFVGLMGIRTRSGSKQAGFERLDQIGEYYIMLLGVGLGASLMVSTTHLLTIYLAIELVSLSSYVLANFNFDRKSAEASLKYVLYGSAASGLMLYGISLLYGLTGTLLLTEPTFSQGLSEAPLLLSSLAIGLTLVGFLFKISAVPFHIWAPDIYQGVPTPVAAFFSVVPKIAGIGLLLRVAPLLFSAASEFPGEWLIGLIAMVTMIAGNVAALHQTNAQRMLAYSSIAHSGFLLVGILVANQWGTYSVLFYATTYLCMNLAAFWLIQLFEAHTGAKHIPDYRGLGLRFPVLGVAMLIVMVALTGLPPTAGFTAKLLIFSSLWDYHQQTQEPQLLYILVVGLFNTVIALFYYLKIPYYLFFKSSPESAVLTSPKHSSQFFGKFGTILLTIPLLILFFKADWLMAIISQIISVP